ncbi:MAG: hypothetical protein WDW36_001577 [Sanguina aurantia]
MHAAAAVASKAAGALSVAALAFKSLGIVYGDIGTSPLYVFASIFASPPEAQEVMGATCLIFWTLTSIALVKYICFVLMADDCGEGGTFAMYSLLCRTIGINPHGQSSMSVGDRRKLYKLNTHTASWPPCLAWSCLPKEPICRWIREHAGAQVALLLTTMVATSMLLGDGVLTPAISVLAAVSGLHVGAHSIPPDTIVGISIAILVVLFLAQGNGSSKVACLFAPVLGLWFFANFSIGIYNLVL